MGKTVAAAERPFEDAHLSVQALRLFYVDTRDTYLLVPGRYTYVV
jgi:hypothetical protein